MTRWWWVVAAAAAMAGCGDRPAFWSSPNSSAPPAFDLNGAIALVDAEADRVVLLTPGADQTLTTTSIGVGKQILNAAASSDGHKLFVVSGGHRSAIGDEEPDEPPSLMVIAPGDATPAQRYDLSNVSDPLAGLAIDPAGRWVVLFPSSGGNQPFVENPNELVVIDVSAPPSPTSGVPHTLMSFGGRPQRFTFTPALTLPIGSRQLLIVESDQNLSLLQLGNPANPPEISVPLTNGSDTQLLSPAGVTVYPGDAAGGARVGVRLANDDDVVMLQFVPENDASGNPIGNGFLPTINLNDVGGLASDIAFVHTDSGLRLAALVPSQTKATLIDPVTSLTEDVALPAPYQNLSLVTSATAAANPCTSTGTSTTTTPPADVAILWNGSAFAGQEGVAFWELGQTGCAAYRSIDTVGITAVIGDVMDVPAPHQTLKVLATRDGGSFYVLNLANRTAAPFVTSAPGVALSLSPLGDQVWTYVPNGLNVAATDFADEHPRSLLIERPVSQVFEVARSGAGPVVVVLHDQGGVGATVYDATTLDDTTRRLYAGILLGGAP